MSGRPEPVEGDSPLNGDRHISQTVGSYVYVMDSTTGPLKIGVSFNPQKRLLNFVKKYPHLEGVAHAALFKEKDAYLVEGAVHKLLAAHRVDGECFNVSVVQAIDAINFCADTLGIREKQTRKGISLGRTAIISVRVHPDVYNMIHELAAEDDRTCSKYLESIIISNL